MKKSPLAPDAFPTLPAVGGVQLASVAAGLRYKDRVDLTMAFCAPGTTAAAVFTQSKCPSAPVDWSRQVLKAGAGRAVVCNAGNANAFTGAAGDRSVADSVSAVATGCSVEAEAVYAASTGVIGEAMDDTAMADAISELTTNLAPSDHAGWEGAANAIRTTDTFAKAATARVAGSESVIVGIAKGSGMIAPDMATMLGFVFTDAAVTQTELQASLTAAVESSFNRITVDSDTSTSDMVVTFATGSAGQVDTLAFQAALDEVMLDLARQIIRDGEGATKFVEITVTGAETDRAAKTIALSIANSPLVKTALAAEDANWGRIVMAVGKAGERANRDQLLIKIGPELVAAAGVQSPDYSETRATEHLQQDEIEIRVDVGVADGTATVWTCDLTHGYIDINAGYRS